MEAQFDLFGGVIGTKKEGGYFVRGGSPDMKIAYPSGARGGEGGGGARGGRTSKYFEQMH